MSKKIRILFAAVDIGYRIPHYTRFLEENYGDKVKVESFSKYILPKEHYEMSFTYECPIDKWNPIRVYMYTLVFFIRALFKYNVLHFFSGETILTRKLRRFELMTYKLFKKKIIMHFVGSDIRSNNYLSDKNEHIFNYLKGDKIESPICESYQLKLINDARKYADEIIVSTPDLLEILPEAMYLPVFLDIESLPKIDTIENKDGKIRILHSPSGKRTKGTEHIQKVLHKIQATRKDEIELITPNFNDKKKSGYPMSRYDLLKAMSEVDVVIDQMVIGWYGLKAVESLYYGANVFCFIEKKDFLFENTPIITADVVHLEQEVNKLIDDLSVDNDRMKRLEKNRKWIEKYHSIDAYSTLILNMWSIENE